MPASPLESRADAAKPAELQAIQLEHLNDFDLFKGLKAGAAQGVKDSVTDGEGMAIRGAATAALTYGITHLTGPYTPFRRMMPELIGAAAIVTVASRLIENERPDNFAKLHVKGAKENIANPSNFAESVSRFGTDMAISAGVGLLVARGKWAKDGATHSEWMIGRDAESRYVIGGTRYIGPKQLTTRTHYEYRGMGLEEKTRDLTGFLKARQELHKLPELKERMVELHKPELVGKYWSSRH